MRWIGQKLCGNGRHKWRFVEMYGHRIADLPGNPTRVCSVKERCARPACFLRRTRENIPMPKRVKS